MIPFLKSLQSITDGLPRYNGTEHGQVRVRIFTVPANEQQKKIPFTRVNHAKYMVTDEIAYIGKQEAEPQEIRKIFVKVVEVKPNLTIFRQKTEFEKTDNFPNLDEISMKIYLKIVKKHRNSQDRRIGWDL